MRLVEREQRIVSENASPFPLGIICNKILYVCGPENMSIAGSGTALESLKITYSNLQTQKLFTEIKSFSQRSTLS